MKVLVIDIGGSNVKLFLDGQKRRKFASGPRMTPKEMVGKVKEFTSDWEFDVITIGVPTPIVRGKPLIEPQNLGKGWTGFDFAAAFKKPVKLVNDAAMQALGSYEGGRMLFIGLGTGLGAALIIDDLLVPLELGMLRYSRDRTVEGVLGKAGLKRAGKAQWEKTVHQIIPQLCASFVAEYAVLGGGNAKKLTHLPPATRRGKNENAYVGGVRLWSGNDGSEHKEQHV